MPDVPDSRGRVPPRSASRRRTRLDRAGASALPGPSAISCGRRESAYGRVDMRDLRILLVDDNEVVRLGLKALLGRHPRFEIVGEAGTADEALAKALVHKPDVIVMDVRLPGRSGIDATREIIGVLPDTK